LMFAAEGAITGEATWESYAVNKAIGLATDIAFAGLGKAFKVMRGIGKAGKAAKKAAKAAKAVQEVGQAAA